MNRALQCLPSFQNFLEECGFEKVKNGRSSGGLLATRKEGYRFFRYPRERVPVKGLVEKWEGSDKNLRNWPKIKWPIYIINH